MRHLVTACFMFLMMIASAHADEPRTVAIYKQHTQSPDHKKGNFDHLTHHMLYLSGVADAYKILNSRRTAADGHSLYCQPFDVSLNGNDYIRILDLSLNHPEAPLPDDMTVAEALLLALQEEFPCK